MDKDIRDFAVEDDFFDPFEDEEEDEDQAVPEDAAAGDVDGDEDDSLVGAPLEQAQAVEPELPAHERIEKLLDEMHGMRRLYLKVIGFCREEKTSAEMDAFTEEAKQSYNCIYSPVIIREMLEQAGAIEYLVPEPDEEDVEYVHAAPDARELAPEVAGSEDDDEGGMLVPIVDESKVVRETYTDGDEEVEIDFLEIEQPPEGLWRATPEGLEFVDAMDDVKASEELIAKEPVYVDIYHQILDFVNNDIGRSAKEIDRLVNDSPLLEEPRRYSGYFVARLEREGAIEWNEGWKITGSGKKVLEDMAVQHA